MYRKQTECNISYTLQREA